MKFVGIIPVRMSSSRFPGKPMLKLFGIPMFEHVWRRSKLSKLDDVYIALCDDEIEQHCIKIGAKYIKTNKKHKMCMDRVCEAALKINSDYICTIQGDEPLIEPDMINLTLRNIIKKKKLFATTLAQKIKQEKEIKNANRVKIIWNKNSEVIYISRSVLPSVEKYKKKINFYKMVCVYTMSKKNLMQYKRLKMSYHEKIESIDVLRILDNKLTLGVDIIEGTVENIDVKSDIKPVLKELKRTRKKFKYY